MKKSILAVVLCISGSGAAWSQARPTADRLGDLQIGGMYSFVNSDYVTNRIKGIGGYADFDFRAHYGVEVAFHQVNDGPGSDVYERSYEFGGRYLINHYGRFTPYVKGMYGRGVFNFPGNAANLAYNQMIGAGGVDIAIIPRLNVRAEYEYQHWFGFPPHGLTPQMLNIGVAYHFPGGKPRYLGK